MSRQAIRRKQILIALARVKEARRVATMDEAGFSLAESKGGLNEQDTAKIREATRLWRETWIIHPLDAAIATLELELNWDEYKPEELKRRRLELLNEYNIGTRRGS